MAESVSPLDVRRRIGDLLDRVSLRQEEFIIVRKGRAMAALVPLERLEQLRRFARREALRSLKEARDPAMSEEEAMNLAQEARRWSRMRKAGNSNS
jgi:prevent-host-death family protein